MQQLSNFFGLLFLLLALISCKPSDNATTNSNDTTTTTSVTISTTTPNPTPTPAVNAEGPNINHFPELSLPITIDEKVLDNKKQFRVIEDAAWFSKNYSKIVFSENQNPDEVIPKYCFHTKMSQNQYLVGIIYSVEEWNLDYTYLCFQLFAADNQYLGEAKHIVLDVSLNDGSVKSLVTISSNEIRTKTTQETFDISGDENAKDDEVVVRDTLYTITPNGFNVKSIR